jgi:hypothetical protein
MMITTALLSQYDWEESQPEWDNVPSQNRALITCQWDSASGTLSPWIVAVVPLYLDGQPNERTFSSNEGGNVTWIL